MTGDEERPRTDYGILRGTKSTAIEAIERAETPGELEQLRVDYLGKKGSLTGLLKTLGGLAADERPKAGALINAAKQELADRLNSKRATLEAAALNASWKPSGSTSPCRAGQSISVVCIPSLKLLNGWKTSSPEWALRLWRA